MRTTIALKILMAVSGGVFIAFVLLHMYGNLQAFAGHDAFNEYAEHLRTFGQPMLPYTGLLWVIRIGLVIALVVHVFAAATLWRRARAARTVPYVMKKRTGATFASGLMRWGGVTILLFLVWHLLNFTVGKVNVTGGPTNDPYNLLVDTLRDLVAHPDLPGGDGDARRPPAPRHLERGPDPRLDQPRAVTPGGQADRVHHRRDHRRRIQPGADLRPRRRHREVKDSSQ